MLQPTKGEEDSFVAFTVSSCSQERYIKKGLVREILFLFWSKESCGHLPMSPSNVTASMYLQNISQLPKTPTSQNLVDLEHEIESINNFY